MVAGEALQREEVADAATLLAGSSIGFLGGEALETVDDFETIRHWIGRFVYVASGSLALVSSLWVIIISSHLIALTRDASLRKNILKASRLLDISMKEVRGVHQFALSMLMIACLSGSLLNMTPFLASAFSACAFHLFYNAPAINALVPLQALATVGGNGGCAVAA